MLKAGDRVKIVDNGKLGVITSQINDGMFKGDWNMIFDSGTEGIVKPYEVSIIPPDQPALPTLRDQFAMAAMSAMIANDEFDISSFAKAGKRETVAECAYLMAETMLAAREAK